MRLQRAQPGVSCEAPNQPWAHPKAVKLHREMGEMCLWYTFFFCHTKNENMSGKNAFSTRSFISPVPPHLPDNINCLYAKLGRLTPPFYRYWIQTQSGEAEIVFMLDKSQSLCEITVIAFSPPCILHTWVKTPHVAYSLRQRCKINSVRHLAYLTDAILSAHF